MKKILKFNIFIVLAICLYCFSIINTKAIITDTFKVSSVDSDSINTTIRKINDYHYIATNVGSLTVTTSSNNLKCQFQDINTAYVSQGNTCTLYGGIKNNKDYKVKIFLSSETDYDNPKQYKTLTISVRDKDSGLSDVSIRKITDYSGREISNFGSYYYYYFNNNSEESLKIYANSSNATLSIVSTGISTGINVNKNIGTIENSALKKGKYFTVKVKNGNSIKNYTIAVTNSTGSTAVSLVTVHGGIVRKLNDTEYNVIYKSGAIEATLGDKSATCEFTSVNSAIYSQNGKCGFYGAIKSATTYPFTVTNGTLTQEYKVHVVSNDDNMKDVSIKNIEVNADEILSKKGLDGFYEIAHKGNLYYKVTVNDPNAVCRVSLLADSTTGFSSNTCYIKLNNAQKGTSDFYITNGDTTKYYSVSYELNDGTVVDKSPKKIILNNSSNIYLNQGRSFEITAIVLPGNATNREVSWTTSDSTIASVTDNGMIYGESPGIATITATSKQDSSIKKSVNVIINETTANVVKTTNGDSDNNDTNQLPSSSNSSSSVPSSSAPESNTPGTNSDNKSYLKEIFDINNDKVVNQTDYSIISYYYLKSPKILNSKSFSIWKAHFDVINPNGIDLVNVKDVGFFILGTYSKVSNYNSSNLSSSSSNGIGS